MKRKLYGTVLTGTAALWVALFAGTALAQDLEPRRWSHLPTGLNVAGLATGWSDGDVFFDPALRLEDVEVDTWLSAFAYVRSFDLLGRSARVDVKLPYVLEAIVPSAEIPRW